jgi:hypothetical protein
MKFAWLILVLSFAQDQVPYKPKDQFEISLDFKFKPRPANAMSTTVIEYEKRTQDPNVSHLVLPYLYLNVKVLKLEEQEQRVRIENNKGVTVLAKKAETGMEAKLDLGFTDDIKDRVSSHEYVVSFLTKDRKYLSKIVINFDEDGTYTVNGEKRGKL